MGEVAIVLRSEHQAEGALALTLADEVDLKWYFGLDLPGVPGAGSSFGAMCERLQRVHTKTTERPSDDVPWTEIIFCGHGQGGVMADSVEDAMHHHIDGQRRAQKLRALLEHLSALDYGVLQARFGGAVYDDGLVRMFGELAGVVLVTETIRAENARRAANDQHETADRTVLGVLAASKDQASPKAERSAARRWIEHARRDAEDLTARASAAFAKARRVARGTR